MAKTSAKLIYGTKNGTLRQLIIPSVDDSELAAYVPGTGEDSIVFPITDPKDTKSLGDKVKVKTKKTDIPSGRCALVDPTGLVINAIMADPDLDTHPSGTIVASDLASIGDKYDGKIFTRLLATVDSTTFIVTDISFQDFTKPPKTGSFFLSATGLSVGQTIPRTKSVH
jgi:hypothetical protein